MPVRKGIKGGNMSKDKEEQTRPGYGLLVEKLPDGNIKWGPIQEKYEKVATIHEARKLIKELADVLDKEDIAVTVVHLIEARMENAAKEQKKVVLPVAIN